MGSLPYWIILLVPAVAAYGLSRGGAWTSAGLVLVFVFIPIAEGWTGLRKDNDDTDGPARRWTYDLPLFAWIPVHLAVQGYALWLVVTGALSGWELVVAAAAVGTTAGAGGINIAHELMHRKSPPERAVAELLMATVTYTHFCIEHVYGHHRHVATPLDPASSRTGESVYRYLPRTIFGGLLSAMSIERARCRRRGISPYSLRNRMTRYFATQAALYVVLLVALGPMAALFWFGQSLVAIVLLEVINYVEHYGLQRREIAPGRYERTQPWHSWNASHRLTNWLLFNLQRHSDHHYLASRSYHQLRHYDDVPQLPAGYATMILVALVPPLWRRVMDPRVQEWNRRRPVDTVPSAA
jgi:alkane 1-monooxygenase